MSRIAKHPIKIAQGVELKLNGSKITAKGKLGELSYDLPSEVAAELKDGAISVTPKSQSKQARALWGTAAARIRLLIKGVSEGYRKKLVIEGVGYRAAVQGKDLVMQLGYSHEVRFAVPAGIEIKAPKQTEIEIFGADKQRVGQIAAEIISHRPPEPYKGKGIMYEYENGQRQQIRRKEGKKK